MSIVFAMRGHSRINAFLTIACLAACLGTLTSAALVVAAYLLMVFVFPVLLLPYAGWAVWAVFMHSMGRLRPIAVGRSIIFTVIIVPICAYLPYEIARQEMLLRAADIPDSPGLTVSSISADPFGNSSTGPGVLYRLEAHNEVLPAVRDLTDKLVTQGWDIVVGAVPNARGSGFAVLFSKPGGRSLSLRGSWNRTSHVYENVTLRENLSPISPGLLLLTLLAGALISVTYASLKGSKAVNENDT